jgi:hypothetical protein
MEPRFDLLANELGAKIAKRSRGLHLGSFTAGQGATVAQRPQTGASAPRPARLTGRRPGSAPAVSRRQCLP